MPNKQKMKEELQQNMTKPPYEVSMYYWEEGMCQQIARSSIFENVTLGVISFNAFWISIDTQYNEEPVLNDAEPIFILAENFFCIYFLFEWSVRFGAFRSKLNCLRDAWFVFDTSMVTLMIMETWVLFIAVATSGGGAMSGSTGFVKLIRLLRLSRIARMARLLRNMPELLIMIKGIFAALRSVFSSLFLLVIVLYVFAVVFRLLTSGNEYLKDTYFKSVLRSMNSLLVFGVMGDNFGELGRDLAAHDDHPYMMVVGFYVFVLLGQLTIMNMLIGILCEVVCATAEVEQEGMALNYMREKLKEIVDGSEARTALVETAAGTEIPQIIVTKADFLGIFQKKETALLLEELEVDAVELVDIIDTIFMESSGVERHLEFNELLIVLMNHRNTKVASVKDVVDLRRDFSIEFDMVADRISDFSKVDTGATLNITAKLDALCGMLGENLGSSPEDIDEQIEMFASQNSLSE